MPANTCLMHTCLLHVCLPHAGLFALPPYQPSTPPPADSPLTPRPHPSPHGRTPYPTATSLTHGHTPYPTAAPLTPRRHCGCDSVIGRLKPRARTHTDDRPTAQMAKTTSLQDPSAHGRFGTTLFAADGHAALVNVDATAAAHRRRAAGRWRWSGAQIRLATSCRAVRRRAQGCNNMLISYRSILRFNAMVLGSAVS